MQKAIKYLIILSATLAGSPLLADDLDPKGIVLSPTGSRHYLDDNQCRRVLDSWSAMGATGRARIKDIAVQCRSQINEHSKPEYLSKNAGNRAAEPTESIGQGQATQSMMPMLDAPLDHGYHNISPPMQPAD